MREVEHILREVLRTSRGDGHFDDVLNRVLESHQPGSSFHRMSYFRRFLVQSCRRADRDADWFTIVQHVVEDLLRLYGLPREEPRRSNEV